MGSLGLEKHGCLLLKIWANLSTDCVWHRRSAPYYFNKAKLQEGRCGIVSGNISHVFLMPDVPRDILLLT